jgi:hypothetical protein
MGDIPNKKEMRELKSLAQMLRGAAEETDDQNYIGLFLSAAMALEERAIRRVPRSVAISAGS